jgi:hypothetical protein
MLVSERETRDRISEIEARVIELQRESVRLEAGMKGGGGLKRLLWSDGDTLVGAVRESFETIGFDVVAGPDKRAALIARRGDTILSIHVDADDGAANDWATKQCARWVDEVEAVCAIPKGERDPILGEYASALESLSLTTPVPDEGAVQIKGLIVANTYRNTPPNERPNDGFPTTMENLLRRRDLAAISGVQLLCLLQEMERADANRVESLLNGLLSTCGIFSDVGAPAEYISDLAA